MGRTQYGSSTVRAAGAGSKDTFAALPAPKKDIPGASSSSDSPEWDIYASKKPEDRLAAQAPAVVHETQPASSVPAAKSVAAPVKSMARYQPPRIPRGAFLLQVAALKGEGDALALTDALQQKQFPAFVVTPMGDNLYRVQVGPYADAQSVNLAKLSLEREGYKAIIKH
jgi:cell division septation protein DedD